MSEILLCNQAMNANVFEKQCGLSMSDIAGMDNPLNSTGIHPYQPYLIGQSPSSFDRNIMCQLGRGESVQNLANLSLSFGEENTLALAEITAKLREYGINAMGASTTAYMNRIDGFGKAVKKYQDALMNYRNVIKGNPAARVAARQKAFAAFKELQSRFQHELNAITSATKARRGTPLGNPTRATNIARSSRNVAKLKITSQVQAHNLVSFTKHAKLLGNGLVLLDFTSRVGNIHNSYRAGDNWERELFIESSSFALSTVTGAAVVNTGLTLMMMATPVGWFAVIAGGVIVAGAAAASMGMNYAVKNNSGDWYDSIMKMIQH